jgi:AMMECR1 domain-containing protein
MKAGLATDAWKNKDTSIHYFEGIIFSEQSPNGKIERRNIK